MRANFGEERREALGGSILLTLRSSPQISLQCPAPPRCPFGLRYAQAISFHSVLTICSYALVAAHGQPDAVHAFAHTIEQIVGVLDCKRFCNTLALVIALLKRRWFSSPCAVALMACSCIDVANNASVYRSPTQMYGLKDGMLRYAAYPEHPGFAGETWAVEVTWHWPMLGGAPDYERKLIKLNPTPWTYVWIFIPLWLLLCPVLGWLVIRELQLREKRAKAAEAAEGTAR